MSAPLARRSLLVAAAGAYVGAARPARAQAPAIKLVVPSAAGGITDQAGRILARELQETLGRVVIVENRAGAGGRIGAESVMRAEPDGSTLLLSANGTLTYIPAVERASGFEPMRDLSPISQIASYGLLMVVNPSLPAKSVQEFISHARSHPGALNYASSGRASGLHFAGEVFKSMAGIEMTHIPYKGSAPAVQDVIGNACQAMFAPGEVLALIEGGKLRALGVTTLHRDPRLPELPTISEAGLPGYDVGAWMALYGPQRLPVEARDRLQSAVARALANAEIRKRLAALGMNIVGGGPQELAALMRAETAKLREVATRLRIQPDS